MSREQKIQKLEKENEELGSALKDARNEVRVLKCKAERVQELEKAHELKDLEHQGLVAQLKEKEQQNKRCRKALEQIGDYDWETHSEVVGIARQALGDDSNPNFSD